MLTMALCGLWHGAGWNFVLWGTLHGAAIVFALGWRRASAHRCRRLIGWAATIAFFLLSCVIFRTATLEAAWNVYSGLVTLPDGRMLSKAWIVARDAAVGRAAGDAGSMRPHDIAPGGMGSGRVGPDRRRPPHPDRRQRV